MAKILEWELIKRIHEIIQAGLPDANTIKKFYIGVPDNENTLTMPCIASELVDIESRLGPTGMDKNVYTIDMYIFFDKKKGVHNAAGRGGARSRANYQEMLDLIAGIDYSGEYATYKATSLLGILRSHIFLSGGTINTNSTEIVFNTDIDVQIGPSDTTRSFFEAKITLQVHQLISLNSRL